MKTKFLVSMMIIATLALPVAAQAQGTVRGAEEGAAQGAHAAGPVGAIVGGTVGAAVGTVGGILGVEERHASTNMSCTRGCRPIAIATNSAWAPYCRRAGSPTTTFRPITT